MPRKGTILLKFSAGRPQFHKLDKVLTSETQNRNAMSEDSGNFNKHLIPKKYFEKWDKTITMLRTRFYELTSPWDDSGYRICTPDAFWQFQKEWREHEAALEAFKNDFISRYTDIRDEQQRRLGNAFDPGEFPDPDETARRFRVETDVAQVPEKGGATSILGEQKESEIIAKAEDRLNTAHKENYQRLFKALSHLAKTVKDPDKLKRCKSSTLENVREIADLIPALNFMDDPGLQQLADDARTMCEDLDIKELKQSEEALREDLAKKAGSTASHIETMMELYA